MTTVNTSQLVRSIDNQVELLAPVTDTPFALPGGSGLGGKMWTVANNGTAKILVQSSAGQLVRTVYPGTVGQVIAIQDAPVLAAHWGGVNVSIFTGTWWRLGKNMNVKVHMKFSGVGSGLLHFGLADSKVFSDIDAALCYTTNAYSGLQGNGFVRDGTTGNTNMAFPDIDSGFPATSVAFNMHGNNNYYNTGSTVTNTEIHLAFTVPILAWSNYKG
jgi:hypothetical protein